MNRSLFLSRTAAVFAVGALASGLLVGCGGSNETFPTAGASQFAGRSYHSTFSMGERGTTTVDVTVQNDGTASGTAVVNDGRAVTRVVVGRGNVTGSVDENGQITLSGSIMQNEVTTPISVSGNLNENAILGWNGTFYTATWSVFTTPVASPTPGATPTPGTSPTPSPTPGGGSGTSQGNFSDLTFSAVSGANASSTGTPLKAVSGAIVVQTVPFVGSLSTVTVADLVNGVARTVTITTLGTLAAGQTISIDGGANTVIYSEVTQGQTTLPRAFGATSGTIKIDSISGNTYHFTLQNVALTAGPSPQASTGTGSFTLNGTITAQQ